MTNIQCIEIGKSSIFAMAISCKAIDKKIFLAQFPNQYRVGFQKIPTFFPEQFVRVIHLLQLHVQSTLISYHTEGNGCIFFAAGVDQKKCLFPFEFS